MGPRLKNLFWGIAGLGLAALCFLDSRLDFTFLHFIPVDGRIMGAVFAFIGVLGIIDAIRGRD